MKVIELIEQLKKQDPKKEVMIQQGEDYGYMKPFTVREMQLWNIEAPEEDQIKDIVVINYTEETVFKH